MREAYRLLKIVKENQHKAFAQATVIGVEGSSYRHVGAKMMFTAEGDQYGAISAGCLEEDLFYHAKEVMESKQNQLLSYDLRSEDDLSWGQGAGCNGSIRVYVEPIQWDAKPLFHDESVWPRVLEILDAQCKIVCAKCISGKVAPGTLLFYAESGEIVGKAQDQETETEILSCLKQFILQDMKFEYKRIEELESDFVLELYEPLDLLYVFGAGPDAEPLVELASKMDFAPIVIDPRGSRCCEALFPTAHALIVEHPESYLAKQLIAKNSYVLVMTHSFQRDQTILQFFIDHPPKYLGALGPRRRTQRLLGANPSYDWIYTPIGLDIGAEGPEEISISVVSQLIQIRNSKRKNRGAS